MFSFPALLSSAELSLFGAGGGESSLSYGGADAERYDALLKALFAIVQIVGLVSFLKGWFVLRSAADGHGRATMGSGAWHIVGGLLAWHIVPVLGAVQETVGSSCCERDRAKGEGVDDGQAEVDCAGRGSGGVVGRRDLRWRWRRSRSVTWRRPGRRTWPRFLGSSRC